MHPSIEVAKRVSSLVSQGKCAIVGSTGVLSRFVETRACDPAVSEFLAYCLAPKDLDIAVREHVAEVICALRPMAGVTEWAFLNAVPDCRRRGRWNFTAEIADATTLQKLYLKRYEDVLDQIPSDISAVVRVTPNMLFLKIFVEGNFKVDVNIRDYAPMDLLKQYRVADLDAGTLAAGVYPGDKLCEWNFRHKAILFCMMRSRPSAPKAVDQVLREIADMKVAADAGLTKAFIESHEKNTGKPWYVSEQSIADFVRARMGRCAV